MKMPKNYKHKQNVGQIDIWAQLHQPIGAKCKCAGTESLAQSVLPTKLNQLYFTYNQKLHSTFMLCDLWQ